MNQKKKEPKKKKKKKKKERLQKLPEEKKFNHKVMSPKSPISRAVNNKMVFQREHGLSHERTHREKNRKKGKRKRQMRREKKKKGIGQHKYCLLRALLNCFLIFSSRALQF